MSLDRSKLENVVNLADGGWRARCPACAETGHDNKGEHLRVYPGGRFGCCAYPGEGEHRRRIFAIAGDRDRKAIRVNATAGESGGPIRRGIFGRLARLFLAPAKHASHPDATDACSQVRPGPNDQIRTPRTGQLVASRDVEFGTEGDSIESLGMLNEASGASVPSVQPSPESEKGVRAVRMPYLKADGTLVIPFDSPERYHWWKGGQSVAQTRMELTAKLEYTNDHNAAK